MAIHIPILEMTNTIVRLPAYMREANRGLFEPRVVSIGPYHRNNESTHDMEAHKEHFLEGFFQRSGNASREHYIGGVTANCFAQAHQCYMGNVGDYTAEMLTRDGCFIIELLLQWKERETCVDNHVRLMLDSIYYDLLLVDNQLPFFVLAELFDKFKTYNLNPAFDGSRLLQLVSTFFNHKGQFSWAPENPSLPNANQVCHHLLDIQYNLVKRENSTHYSSSSSSRTMPLGIPGANELQDYGVKFVNKNEQTDIFDVTFRGKIMMIPRFQINFGSKILLANLFAYDQIKGGQTGNQTESEPGNSVGLVTSYVVLMNALINTKDDVLVLQREGILDNLLSNEEEVASFFNKLGRCALVDVREHRYIGMFNDVNKYWMNPFNLCKYLSIFRMKHFRNPWTCFSLLGAIMVLVFSCTSMVIAILNYRRLQR